jgi:ABC-type dipeptide/oligopeptide/nickel transport system permease subunit
MIPRIGEGTGGLSMGWQGRMSRGRSKLHGLHWSVRLGGGVFIFICVVLLLTPWIAPYNPDTQVLTYRLAPPTFAHWLGTDVLGRDELSRLMFGGRFSVTLTTIVLLLSSTIGTILGVVSGRVGGVFDEVTMRTVDVLLAFPDVLMALVLVAILGAGPAVVVLALTIVGWTPFARLARAMTIDINNRGYIEAAKALGCSQRFIMFRHILPNALTPVLAQSLNRWGHYLIIIGSLSYLGLGVQPPASDWGSMLADGQPYMQQDPLLVVVPGVTIFITALAVTMAGQGLAGRRLGFGSGGRNTLTRQRSQSDAS